MCLTFLLKSKLRKVGANRTICNGCQMLNLPPLIVSALGKQNFYHLSPQLHVLCILFTFEKDIEY